MEALGKFLGKRNFNFNDITLSNYALINKIGESSVKIRYTKSFIYFYSMVWCASKYTYGMCSEW